jgi:hypothetical protein
LVGALSLGSVQFGDLVWFAVNSKYSKTNMLPSEQESQLKQHNKK